MRVSAVGARPRPALSGSGGEPAERTGTRVVFDGEWVEVQLWRGELPVGTRLEGPALCAMAESTLLVPVGWDGSVDEHGTVVLERAA